MLYIDILMIAVLCISVYTDLRYSKIYNKILLPTVVLALLIHLVFAGAEGFIFWIRGLLLGAGFLIIPFILGGIGAGDVKLLATVGALKGTHFVLYSFVATALIGGAISIIVVLYKSGAWRTLRQAAALPGNLPWKITFPYGLAIGLGTAVTYWVTYI